ncbi:MAG: DUF4190 domain-containing protein [Methylacidiphilales bacterium]|nr:DUF4190 domain-containing protein [Candidatus Methylacidiphilales bacterium]
MKIWYYAKAGRRYGPTTREAVEKLYREGKLKAKDLVWEQGTPEWLEAGAVLETAPSPPSPAPASTPAPGTAAETCGLAILSLCCSFIGLACCCGAPILAIPGVILGHLSLYRLSQNPNLKGREIALAGMIIGYLVIAIALLGWLGWSLKNPLFTGHRHLL